MKDSQRFSGYLQKCIPVLLSIFNHTGAFWLVINPLFQTCRPHPKPSQFCSCSCNATNSVWAAQISQYHNTNRTALVLPTNKLIFPYHRHTAAKMANSCSQGWTRLGITEILPISSTCSLVIACFLHTAQQLSCLHASIPH